MAQIHGDSVAFAELLSELFRIDSRMQPSDPCDLARSLRERLVALERSRSTLPAEILQEVAYRLADLDEQERALEQRHARLSQEAAQRDVRELARVQALRDREGFILVRWFWQLRASWLERRVERQRAEALREREMAKLELRQARERLRRLQSDPEGEARHRLAREFAVWEALDAAARAPLAQHAAREAAAVAELQSLPAGYVVLRGLLLEADRFVRWEGRPPKPELVDLVVVAPSGVFVIDCSPGACGVAADVEVAHRGRAIHAAQLLQAMLKAARLPERVAVQGCPDYAFPPWPAGPQEAPGGGGLLAEAIAGAPADRPLDLREVEAIAAFLQRCLRRNSSSHGSLRLRKGTARSAALACGTAHSRVV